MWWSNNESRRQQKEGIKAIIKRTKLSEKTSQMNTGMGADTPPELSYSLPTSDTFSDSMDRTRSVSVDSNFGLQYDFNNGPGLETFVPYVGLSHVPPYVAAPYPTYSPYEVDVKTERQTFVNDVPTRRDSSISTFSTFQPPPPMATLPSYPAEFWTPDESLDGPPTSYSTAEEGLNFNFFDFSHDQAPHTSQQALIQVDENDRTLLDHFIDNVLRLIFPILEVNQHGSARSEVILPALESNKCYLHCCLSIAALHLKTTQGIDTEQINSDIMRHRYATVSELCEALTRDTDHQQILEATLGMIFFQCSVGRADDILPDIAWHSHFQAAASLVHKLELPRALTEVGNTHFQPPFNMTLASWIDILGATMLGRSPLFSDTYREKHLTASTSGLCELMGCDDRVMYIISEIACLEGLKLEGRVDDILLCSHIHSLAEQIGALERDGSSESHSNISHPFSHTGALRPKQLARNMTAAFRLAARIYLCTLVPGFDKHSASTMDLVNKMAETLEFIPDGPEGFERSLVWPLLIAGSVSTPNSSFRRVFAERCEGLGEHAKFGSFGRMERLLQEVWCRSDQGSQHHVHWRDVMQQNGWDFLLI
jgi:hypothetical protein